MLFYKKYQKKQIKKQILVYRRFLLCYNIKSIGIFNAKQNRRHPMTIIPIHVNDRIKLKKTHPCGGCTFLVLRVGAAVRIKCETCQRDMTIDRIKLEKAIKEFLEKEPNDAIERNPL